MGKKARNTAQNETKAEDGGVPTTAENEEKTRKPKNS